MAHELTHYAIRKHDDKSIKTISAFEEPAASAMSLYILKLSAEQWNRCDFSEKQPDYATNFEIYRDKEYMNVKGNIPCDYGEWVSINARYTGTLTSALQRPDVTVMRNHLYDTSVEMPDSIEALIRYPLYLRSDEKLVDEDRWAIVEPECANFVRKICEIQPTVA